MVKRQYYNAMNPLFDEYVVSYNIFFILPVKSNINTNALIHTIQRNTVITIFTITKIIKLSLIIIPYKYMTKIVLFRSIQMRVRKWKFNDF